mgnify:CR=1 FL=1
MPRKPGTLVLSTIVIAIALLAPLFVAYAADQMRTYTMLEKKFSAASYMMRVDWDYYNGSNVQNSIINIDYTTDGDDIIIPTLPSPSDGFSSTKAIQIFLNGTLLKGSDIWEAKCVKLIAYCEMPNTQSEQVSLKIYGYDDGGSPMLLNTLEKTPNTTAWTIELEYTTIMLSKYATSTGVSSIGAGLTLSFENVNVGPDDYVLFRVVWYVGKAPFSQSQIDLLLLGSGIVMMVCAAFATPYLSLKQLQALGRGRRR